MQKDFTEVKIFHTVLGGGYFKKKHPEAWLDQTPCKIHC